jgi:hypothetical protein
MFDNELVPLFAAATGATVDAPAAAAGDAPAAASATKSTPDDLLV